MPTPQDSLHRIFESDVVGILEMDAQFVFRRASKGFREMLGYTMAELSVKDMSQITHPEDLAYSFKMRDQLMSGDNLVRYQKRCITKDGQAVQCLMGIQCGDRGLDQRPTWYLAFVSPLTEIITAQDRARSLSNKLDEVYRETAGALARAIESRDSYTAGHQESVGTLAVRIGEEMKLDAHQIYGLYLAGVVHDIGKIGVPPEFLGKVTKLSTLEFDFIRQHSQFGHEILNGVKSPWPLAQSAFQHHERLDGTGYPNKLVGNAILLESRIIAVADTVDSMIKPRPYRGARSVAETEKVLLAGRGTTLDADVVDACLRLDVLSKPLGSVSLH